MGHEEAQEHSTAGLAGAFFWLLVENILGLLFEGMDEFLELLE